MRIAAGAGVRVSDVNQVLKQFAEMRKMMKQLQTQGGKGRRRGLKLPPGMSPF